MTKTKEAPAPAGFLDIPYDQLVPAEDNVRDEIGDVNELAASIVQVGLLQPLRVVPIDDGRYKIVAGHRRHAALGKLIAAKQWDRPVPCVVSNPIEDPERIAAMLIENMHRSDLNPIEEAHGYLRLTAEFGYKQATLATATARSPKHISSRLALLKLPELVIEQVRTGRLPLEIAGQLASLGDHATVLKLTANGTGVPGTYAIDDARKKLATVKLDKAWVKALEDAGIAHTHDPRPVQRLAVFITDDMEDPKELGQLKKIPKNAVAHIQVMSYSGRVTCSIVRPRTAEELDAYQAEQETARAEMQSQWEKERAAKEAERLATLPPAIVAWEAECLRAREAHRDAMATWEAKRHEIEAAWAKSVDAKVAARWAMLSVVKYHIYDVVRALNLTDPDTDDPEEILANFCTQSAANLVQAVATAVYYDAWQEGDEDHDAIIGHNRYVLKHLEPEPQLVLPQHPDKIAAGQDDEDEEMTEEEADAIRAEQDRAAEDADAPGNYGDDD